MTDENRSPNDAHPHDPPRARLTTSSSPSTILPGAAVAGLAARERVPRGHKMAVRAIAKDEPVLKFGQIIGFASSRIAPGDWVHEHNVALHDFERDYRFCRGRDERRTAAA